jgi:uncharacterized protein
MLGEVWVYKQDQTTVSGMITKYYPDGSVSGTMEVTNGVLEGSFVGYFQNGNLSIEGLFDNGKRNGEWKYYNDDGSLKKVREYHSDEVISDTRYDSEGNIHKFQQHKK